MGLNPDQTGRLRPTPTRHFRYPALDRICTKFAVESDTVSDSDGIRAENTNGDKN